MRDLLDVLRDRVQGRVVLVAIGDPRHGDAGAGQALLTQLRGRTDAILVDAHESPEDQAFRVAAEKPDVVVLVTAANVGLTPGSIALVEASEFAAAAFASHNPSLIPFRSLLRSEGVSNVFALAIQTDLDDVGTTTSAAVEAAVRWLADALASCPGQARSPGGTRRHPGGRG